ncbi:MAG: signal peptidase I [Halothiobacillaceae bacterium]|nr:signal peptidase I [Halothiobacillaceae bacterium]MDD3609931.1 signal peptidase I [Halothiobacillaceae bacterium]
MNFALILVLATALSGVIWLIDALFFAPARRARAQAAEPGPREPVLVEYARSFFPVLLVVLLLRSFVAEPFRIPSGSMMPTLQVGDFILVNKFSYGLKLPVTDTLILPLGKPQHGDIVVFRYPQDPRVDFIKRVIGLPGDRVRYQDKMLYINGQPVPQQSLGIYGGDGDARRHVGASLIEENLDGIRHEILVESGAPMRSGEWVVPEGHYFVMGDNRDNSNDSRFWGFVPERNLVGKAFFRWMHFDWQAKQLQFSRIGDTLN